MDELGGEKVGKFNKQGYAMVIYPDEEDICWVNKDGKVWSKEIPKK